MPEEGARRDAVGGARRALEAQAAAEDQRRVNSGSGLSDAVCSR